MIHAVRRSSGPVQWSGRVVSQIAVHEKTLWMLRATAEEAAGRQRCSR